MVESVFPVYLRNYFRSFWECLISVGVSSEVSEQEEKYVRFTNVVAVLTCLAVASYIPHSLYKGYYTLALLQVIDTIFVLSVLGLNHLQLHKTARQVYLLVINSFVLINSCFIGHASGVHEFFYISYVVPFLLFSVRDYKNIVIGVLFAIFAFNVYQHIHPFFTAYNVDLVTQQNIARMNMWMKFVLFGIAIYILAYYNYTTETDLAVSNKKLREQAVELQRSNEDLEQFAYIISHDLKAPVRNIGSFMSLLLSRFSNAMPSDSRSLVELSKTSSDRLSKQIDDLLSYCKVGRNLPPASSVNLQRMIMTIEMELGEKIREKKAEVIVAGELPVLHQAHSSMIHHVFQNLIANGIKFNTNASPQVVISCQENSGFYTFSVSDNGIGIDKAYKDKLFQMFRRLHTADQFEGTGIGLAVCKKIVNFYEGDIWFESKTGEGTTFSFTFKKAYSAIDVPDQSLKPVGYNLYTPELSV